MFVVLLAFGLGIIRRDAYAMPETHVETNVTVPTTTNVLNASGAPGRGQTYNESIGFSATTGLTARSTP